VANGIELATAYVSLEVDGSGVSTGVRKSLAGVDAQADRVGRSSGKKMGAGISAGILGAVGKMAGPLAAVFAGLGIGRLFSDAITAGSDLQQALGGAGAVFKGELAGIESSADDAALALGLSKTAYLELATVLGASLKNKGIDDFAGQAENLITIGADLAAQFGGSTQDAVDALASALRGERDPIERYGVSLNEAAIKAEALRLGLGNGTRALTEQEKAMATLSLVAKQTADAQGAFGREADTYAGKQARLAATWDDLKTRLGTALLPALTNLSDWFLREGLPALERFGTYVSEELWPALRDGWETIRPGLEQAQQIIAEAFGGDSSASMKDFAGFITSTLIPAVATFASVYLPILAKQFSFVIDAVQAAITVMTAIRNAITSVTSAILSAFIRIAEGFQSMLATLGRVPGFGWARDAARKMQEPIDKLKAIRTGINNLPRSRTIDVTVRYNATYRNSDLESTFSGVGGRAAGGPVRAGQPYIVGEKRPELFIPDQNGTILPRVPESMGENRTYEQPIIVQGDVRTQSVVEFEEEMYHRRRRAVLSAPGR
jgi:hypothetical protein